MSNTPPEPIDKLAWMSAPRTPPARQTPPTREETAARESKARAEKAQQRITWAAGGGALLTLGGVLGASLLTILVGVVILALAGVAYAVMLGTAAGK